jgi:hypothetical protein
MDFSERPSWPRTSLYFWGKKLFGIERHCLLVVGGKIKLDKKRKAHRREGKML